MKNIKLLLIPQPGAKPEFLADLKLEINKDTDNPKQQLELWNQKLPSQVVLEAYTRDGWAWKPNSAMISLSVSSTDGRRKLPGFLDYLKQRQKSAYGRFGATGVWVVSYIQKAAADATETIMSCRVSTDLREIPKCTLQPKQQVVTAKNSKSSLHPTASPQKKVAASSSSSSGIGGGLLGKLVGAQHRTNQHVVESVVQTRPAAPVQADYLQQDSSPVATTAQQVLADFRQAMHTKMLDFDLNESEQVLKVPLVLSNYTQGLSDEDKAQRVTMEILKYIVYEAAEEVNEEWVAHKEPSEFMDEVTIAVYKEGAAPPDVLEDINKGELPDEVRGQQRALQEQRHRQVNKADMRSKQAMELEAHRNLDEDGDPDEFATLNTNKRDRRTIEDYERERNKRPRED